VDVGRLFGKEPPREEMTSLRAIVDDFRWRFPREKRDMVVVYCEEAATLRQAIKRACASRAANGKMSNHQSRVPEAVRQTFKRALLDVVDEIASAPDFDALHEIADRVKPPGIGPVTLYDVSTRIAARLALEPTSLYLHAGVAQGLRALERATGSAARATDGIILAVDLHDVWPEFASLTPDETEDLICTYREVFPRLGEEPE